MYRKTRDSLKAQRTEILSLLRHTLSRAHTHSPWCVSDTWGLLSRRVRSWWTKPVSDRDNREREAHLMSYCRLHPGGFGPWRGGSGRGVPLRSPHLSSLQRAQLICYPVICCLTRCWDTHDWVETGELVSECLECLLTGDLWTFEFYWRVSDADDIHPKMSPFL